MIDKIWMPAAIKFGISISEFWNLNPKYMEMYQTDYSRKVKERYDFTDFQAWKHGEYVLSAIAACLDGKKHKYPQKPYSMEENANDETEEINIYEKVRRSFRAMNERIKETKELQQQSRAQK